MKHIIVASLLLLICGSLIFGQEKKADDYRAKAPYCWTTEQLNKELGVDQEVDKDGKPIVVQPPKDCVTVIYFHRSPGCQTCQMMSKYVFETMTTKFPEQVKTKSVTLKYLNFEDKKNEKIVKKLKIGSPTMVVLQTVDSKDTKAKRCDKIWEFAGDKKEFLKFVEKEIKDYLPKPTENAQ